MTVVSSITMVPRWTLRLALPCLLLVGCSVLLSGEAVQCERDGTAALPSIRHCLSIGDSVDAVLLQGGHESRI